MKATSLVVFAIGSLAISCGTHSGRTIQGSTDADARPHGERSHALPAARPDGETGVSSAHAPAIERPHGRPVVTPGVPVAGGGPRTLSTIRTIVNAHNAEISYCYERQLEANPALAGRLEVQLEIAPTGSVQAARVASSTLADATTEGCLVRAFGRWSFPPDAATVVIPLTFSVAPVAAPTSIQVGTPASWAERLDGPLPDHLRCSDSQPCIGESDGAYYAGANGWGEHYRIDAGRPDIPIRADSPNRAELRRRIRESLRAVLAGKQAPRVRVKCDLAGDIGPLIGLGAWATAKVPAARQRAGQRPAALTPEQANAVLREAYERADYPIDPERPVAFFSEDEMRTMTADTFVAPRLQLRGATSSSETEDRWADVIAVWSPESRLVWVLDLSYAAARAERSDRGDRRRQIEQRAIELLQALRLRSVAVDTYALCTFPRLTGAAGRWLTGAVTAEPSPRPEGGSTAEPVAH